MPARTKTSSPKDSTAHLGFEAKLWLDKDDDLRWQWSGATWTTRQGCPESSRGGANQFVVPPLTAPRACALWESEALPQVASAARDNIANIAWVQHFIHHLAPSGTGTSGGMAGFVLANGSMSSNQSDEGEDSGSRQAENWDWILQLS